MRLLPRTQQAKLQSPAQAIVVARAAQALQRDNDDVYDDGSLDVQSYPLPPALLAAADRILGAEEVDRLLSGGR